MLWILLIILNLAKFNSATPIANGVDVNIMKYYFLVHIKVVSNVRDPEKTYVEECTGSIIRQNPNIALTAAHCIDDPLTLSTIIVYGGTPKFPEKLWNECQKEQNAIVWTMRGFHIHELYKSRYEVDIALIYLSDPQYPKGKKNFFSFTVGVFGSLPTENTELVVTGWGDKENNLDPDILQEGTMKLQKDSLFSGSLKHFHKTLKDDKSKNGVNICSGDSGGPIIYNNQIVGVGVISEEAINWSMLRRVCEPGGPATFIEIDKIKSWIEVNYNFPVNKMKSLLEAKKSTGNSWI